MRFMHPGVVALSLRVPCCRVELWRIDDFMLRIRLLGLLLRWDGLDRRWERRERRSYSRSLKFRMGLLGILRLSLIRRGNFIPGGLRDVGLGMRDLTSSSRFLIHELNFWCI